MLRRLRPESTVLPNQPARGGKFAPAVPDVKEMAQARCLGVWQAAMADPAGARPTGAILEGYRVTQSALGSLISRLLQGPGETQQVAAKLFNKLVAQSRARVFYQQLGVPDTVDGRFDMVALHTFLIFQRLKGQGDRSAILSQALYDTLIKDMEASLRQLGAGDIGVGKRIRVMTEALQGRIKAYEVALAGSHLDIEGALRRNLYGTTDPDQDAVRIVANYVRQAKELADSQPVDRIMRGMFEFPPAPAGTSNGGQSGYSIE